MLLLSIAAVFVLGDVQFGGQMGLGAAFLRVGLILATLWLAYPQLAQVKSWLPAVALFAALLLALPWRLKLIAIPLVVALLLANMGGGKKA